ncbi:helix-turn-helix domain-containing protein [Actinophytocola oryzae]|uniref:helix-turn-helix domain-containing protein n=1 Tax=Actinophytocola oryzae TaxID=502181 RepID=UPI00106297D8
MTHPHHARGIHRRLTPRPRHPRASSPTHETPPTTSPEQTSGSATEGDQAISHGRPVRDLGRVAPTASTEEGSGGAADTRCTDLPGAGVTAPLLYTAEQAATLLQVRPSWLRRKAAARAVPCRFVGKHLRFSHTDIETIAENSATPSRHSS